MCSSWHYAVIVLSNPVQLGDKLLILGDKLNFRDIK